MYERERIQADMTKAAELAKALDVPVAYLFAEDDDLAAAILAFAKLPSAERQRMWEELERLAGKQRDKADRRQAKSSAAVALVNDDYRSTPNMSMTAFSH